jgi:glycosyltransferase involved in cell wall biosynthesis
MKIRVLEILATLKRAGAEHVATSLACRLDRKKFETAVVSLYDAFADGLEPLLDEHEVPARHLGKRPGFDPRMYPRLARFLREFRPLIVHTHSYVLRYVWPAAAAAGAGRIVHTVHNVADREVDWFGRQVHRFAFRRGAVPVAISRQVALSFRTVYGFEPAATIPNGIDTGRYCLPGAREEWRRAHGISAGDVLFASVARLDPQKNPLLLIEAFARAFGTENDRACRLLLAGDGRQFDAARSRSAALGLSSRIHFLGVRRDIPELLSACDVFVLASDWEGSPISVIEAMAAGLPVIATEVGGVPELVTAGETGILLPPGDTGALCGALEALAADPELRRRYGAAGRQRAARFDVGSMVAAYSELFERLAPEAP